MGHVCEITVFTGAENNRLIADCHIPAVGREHGVPVMLLHGGGQTRYAWGGAAHKIAEAGHRAYSIDQRGHGDSDWVESRAYAYDDYARDVIAVGRQIKELTGQAPVIVGASLGGISGLAATWMGEAGLFSGLVLVDVTPHLDPAGVQRIQGFMTERIREGFASLDDAADAIAAYLPHRKRPKSLEGLSKNLRLGSDGRYRWHWDPAFIDGPRSVNTDEKKAQEVLIEATRALQMPVMLVRGQQSELVTEEAVAKFMALAPEAHFVDVSGARHMVAGDKNDAFNDAVFEFLENLR